MGLADLALATSIVAAAPAPLNTTGINPSGRNATVVPIPEDTRRILAKLADGVPSCAATAMRGGIQCISDCIKQFVLDKIKENRGMGYCKRICAIAIGNKSFDVICDSDSDIEVLEDAVQDLMDALDTDRDTREGDLEEFDWE
ncbi:hypothetical protein BDV96DRAFT_641939 [Lophiotrema nucula]|uniref:Uncharacterized protein n=1 Tax=Lophiotrema nucula TaxID=690887 RepID=A0A6A5ZKG3_9PLEO|nr:hypothetical protein BDV96DRAFT_641939 [Lophiotrema nucula]